MDFFFLFPLLGAYKSGVELLRLEGLMDLDVGTSSQ